MCPYSTSRVQLRTEGLTQPPMGPGRHRPSTHQPHEAPHIHRSEATRRSRASRDANRSDLSGTTTLSHVTRSRRCQAPVSRSTSRRSCHTASDRCQAARRPRRRGARRTGSTTLLVTDRVEPSRSAGTFPMGPAPIGGARAPAPPMPPPDDARDRTPANTFCPIAPSFATSFSMPRL